MLFGQVQAFIQVARTGNVSRAAEALYVTQPALTARIQALEKELGEILFVRTGRGVRLTDAGRVFLPNARSRPSKTVGKRSPISGLPRPAD
jgi:DNA-binding transcriptional LysR family regulator